MYPFRAFVSYARKDSALADGLHAHLNKMGLVNMWDQTLPAARSFTEEIKRRISCSHLFIPLITPNAMERPWVHQETGYALGMSVPIVPIAIDEVPDQLIRDMQALEVGPNLEGLEEKLDEECVEQAIRGCGEPPQPNLLAAHHPESRTDLIVQYMRQVRELPGSAGRLQVRERAAYSTFSIPDADLSDDIWKRQEDGRERSPFLRELLRAQRQEVERAARECGCDLILTPTIEPPGMSARAIRAQLELVVRFLESVDDGHVRVGLRPEPGSNLLIFGDWFTAESHKPEPGRGFSETNFAWHAPSVLQTASDFDRELEGLLETAGVSEKESRSAAIAELNKIIAGLRGGCAWFPWRRKAKSR